jgi:tetratricopeptide (TPR) repeat protein
MELARTNADALRIAIYYSESLDYWGVELQKAATLPDLPPPLKKGELLKDAGDQFAEALRLNPDNLIAQVNLQFNQDLRSVKHTGARISSSDVAGQINSRWELACNLFGPVDVPDLDIQVGQSFANAHDYMQAAHLFQRCLELAPKEYLAELDLAKTYIDLGLVDAGLSLIRDIHEHSTGNPLELVRVEALALSKKHDFLQADKLLAEARARNPKDEFFCGVTAEFYERIGYTLLYESRGDAAKEKEAAKWFKKSAEAYEAQLQLLNGPSKVTANALEIPRVKLRKAEMQMMIKDYDAAIITLTAFLAEDPDSPIPLLDRAMSELQASPSRLDPARKDYLAYVELENKAKEPPDPVAYFGLAQVAQKQNDKPAELQYVKLYLQYAPTNTLEFSNLTQRLHQLEGH